MGNAYQDNRAVERLNDDMRREETTWDGRLTEREMAERAMASEMQRQGGPAYWDLPDADRRWLMDQVDRSRGGDKSYRQAVHVFLVRREGEAHVDELMANFEGRLERIDGNRAEL